MRKQKAKIRKQREETAHDLEIGALEKAMVKTELAYWTSRDVSFRTWEKMIRQKEELNIQKAIAAARREA